MNAGLNFAMAASSTDQLASMMRRTFRQHADAVALELGETTYTYSDLWTQAETFASEHRAVVGEDGAVGILPQRRLEAYVAILGAIIMRRPYVALNMKAPIERQLHIARQSKCRAIVADVDTAERRLQLLKLLDETADLRTTDAENDSFVSVEEIAYYVFTSGTTGNPKGVIVSRDNLAAFLNAMHQVLNFPPHVRCSQFFDLSFDASVHDVFYTWHSGGTLCPMLPEHSEDMIEFARSKKLHSWYSVPSVIALADRSGLLTADALPDLKWSLFVGEALPSVLAEKWLRTAPDSKTYNLYGPTEGTVTMTAHSFDPAGLVSNEYPTVPIGKPHSTADTILVDVRDPKQELESTQSGELWIGGPQVVLGYLNNPEETSKRFVEKAFPGHSSARWYRTGDLVERSPNQDYVFLGRLDDQIKIRGYRAELLEIEEAVRIAAGTSEAAVVPWPITTPGCADGIVAFVAGDFNETDVLEKCAELIPSYLVPARILHVASLPLNQNGKVDRKALRAAFLEVPEEASTAANSEDDQKRELIEAWRGLFPRREITEESSFASLHGDSLSYINALVAAEKILGSLPAHWTEMSIAEIVRQVGATRRRSWVRVDTPAVLRAVAISSVILGHLHYIDLDTGTVAGLMILAGYFFGSLQLPAIHSTGFVRRTLEPLIQVAVVYYLVALPLLYFARGGVDAYDLLLMQDLVRSGTDFRWFIAALLHIFITIALVTPAARLLSRRMNGKLGTGTIVLAVMLSVGTIFLLVVPAFMARSEVVYVLGEPRWWRYSFLGQMLVFGCGALLASRTGIVARGAGIAAALAIAITSWSYGYIGQACSTLICAFALLYLHAIRLPFRIARATYVVANASLLLYLLQPPLNEVLTAHHVERRYILGIVVVAALGAKFGWDKLTRVVGNVMRSMRNRRRVVTRELSAL